MNQSTSRYLDTTVGDLLDTTRTTVDPLTFSYFTRLTEDQWRRSKSLARSSMNAMSGGPYAEYMKSHGPVERAGEYVFSRFLQYYCVAPYDICFAEGNDYIPGFSVSGVTIDVHTRMLKRASQYQSQSLNAGKFLLMVPEIGLARRADIYAFCGYSTDSFDGYAFGWATADEVAAIPVTDDLKHSAKCLSIYDAHPMNTLLDYISSL